LHRGVRFEASRSAVKGIQTPMAKGRSTIIISMIKWIRTSRVSIKDFPSRGPSRSFAKRMWHIQDSQDQSMASVFRLKSFILLELFTLRSEALRHKTHNLLDQVINEKKKQSMSRRQPVCKDPFENVRACPRTFSSAR
jgi:hypothetical protein